MDGQAITTKSDLERILLDESMEAKPLSLSLLKCITNNFSDEHKIGYGGFAVVYKGRLEYGEVAVKKLSQNCIDDEKFIGEVDCMMKAKHKNIVRFLGYCSDTQGERVEHNGKFVMADVRQRLLCFEYVPNGSLDKYTNDASREWGKCYKIIKGVCEGLHYLHKEQIVHLDLKPANILLDNDMVPKITDFGISRCFGELQTHVVTSKLIGSMGYLAPEFYNGKISFKSDIYSLGIIIIEILTGDKDYPEVEKVQEHWSHKLKGSQKEVQLEQIRVCTELGQSCLGYNPETRPCAETINHILKQTESEEPTIKPGASSRVVGPRRLQMRIPTPDPKVIARSFRMCKQAIHKIYAGDTKDMSAEELYRVGYNLCIYKKGGELYSVVETAITSEVQSLCRPLDDAAAPVDSALFLQELLTRWARYSFALQFTCDVFMYMDRTFVPINRKTPIRELGLRLWRDEMARSGKIRQSLIEAVKRQKVGEDELVPGVNKMLTQLGAHVKDMPCLCFQDDTGLHVAGP